MNSLNVELSNLEHRYAEALTAGKDVKTLSKLYEQIKTVRKKISDESTTIPSDPGKQWSIEAA